MKRIIAVLLVFVLTISTMAVSASAAYNPGSDVMPPLQPNAPLHLEDYRF